MNIESSYGFRSAQNAWENASPYDDECPCPQLYMCPECGETLVEGDDCTETAVCVGAPLKKIDREDSTEGAMQNCPSHGWCGGCSSRNCDDCNG